MSIVILFVLIIGITIAALVFIAGKTIIEMKEKEHEQSLEQKEREKKIEQLKEKRVNDLLKTEEERELEQLLEEKEDE